ncbi:MAG TPA: co-chaperone DjlA [Pseudomonadales bacterium]
MPSIALLFGLIGLLLGGLKGLIVGLIIGYAVGLALPRLIFANLAQVQAQLLESTFAAMGALCKADERVTRDEIRAAEALFERMRLDDAQREAAKAAFNRGKQPDFDLDAEMARLAQVCRGRPLLLNLFLQVQLMAIAADGRIHPAEHALLVRMTRRLGLPEGEVARLIAMLRTAAGGPSASASAAPASQLADAYRALGVDPSASDAQIKRAYRKLMSENHPDKLAGRGLPESMREIAEERTREITAAYRLITEFRQQAGAA